MSKEYTFYVTTKISGSYTETLDDDEDPEQRAKEIEQSTLNYDEISGASVTTEVDDFEAL